MFIRNSNLTGHTVFFWQPLSWWCHSVHNSNRKLTTLSASPCFVVGQPRTCIGRKIIEGPTKSFNQCCAGARSYQLVRADCKHFFPTLCSAMSHWNGLWLAFTPKKIDKHWGWKLCLSFNLLSPRTVGWFNLCTFDCDQSALTTNCHILSVGKSWNPVFSPLQKVNEKYHCHQRSLLTSWIQKHPSYKSNLLSHRIRKGIFLYREVDNLKFTLHF